MRVLLCPADKGGTGFYRLWAPGWVLQKTGHAVEFDFQYKGIDVRLDAWGDVRHLGAPECDVVVLQRPMSVASPRIIERLQSLGIAVVVELDDDYWRIDPRSLAFKDFAPSKNPKTNFNILTATCAMADLVTVSTPALARIIPNKNVRVIRNLVPEAYLETQPDRWDSWEALVGSRLVVGWSGDPKWHAGDLETAGTLVARSVRTYGGVFVCLGAEESGPMMGFEDGEALYVPWVHLSEYAQNLANFDIGLVPLRAGAFNESKSYLKGLEYASLGIPFVASPTSEYIHLSKSRVGLIAEQKHDWGRLVARLLGSQDLRDEMAGRGLEFARAHTYEAHSGEWWGAWERALAVRRAHV